MTDLGTVRSGSRTALPWLFLAVAALPLWGCAFNRASERSVAQPAPRPASEYATAPRATPFDSADSVPSTPHAAAQLTALPVRARDTKGAASAARSAAPAVHRSATGAGRAQVCQPAPGQRRRARQPAELRRASAPRGGAGAGRLLCHLVWSLQAAGPDAGGTGRRVAGRPGGEGRHRRQPRAGRPLRRQLGAEPAGLQRRPHDRPTKRSGQQVAAPGDAQALGCRTAASLLRGRGRGKAGRE